MTSTTLKEHSPIHFFQHSSISTNVNNGPFLVNVIPADEPFRPGLPLFLNRGFRAIPSDAPTPFEMVLGDQSIPFLLENDVLKLNGFGSGGKVQLTGDGQLDLLFTSESSDPLRWKIIRHEELGQLLVPSIDGEIRENGTY